MIASKSNRLKNAGVIILFKSGIVIIARYLLRKHDAKTELVASGL